MLTLNYRLCEYCGACTSVCPSKSVQVGSENDALTLNYDPVTCTNCGKCVRVCPMRVLELTRNKGS